MSAPASPLDTAVVAFNSTLRMRILVLIARSPGLGAHDLATSLDIPRATLSLNPVSYTHLTLPTKRIV